MEDQSNPESAQTQNEEISPLTNTLEQNKNTTSLQDEDKPSRERSETVALLKERLARLKEQSIAKPNPSE